MRAVFWRDFRAFFHNMLGPMYLALFLMISGSIFVQDNIANSSASLLGLFPKMCLPLIFIIPLGTMNSFALEKKQGSIQLLISAPLSLTKMIAGKFVACFGLFFLAVLITGIYPLLLLGASQVAFSEIFCSYLGILLLGAALISIGILISALSKSPSFAYGITTISLFTLWLLSNMMPAVSNFPLASILSVCSLFTTYSHFELGLISLSSCLTLLAATILSLVLSITCLRHQIRRSGL